MVTLLTKDIDFEGHYCCEGGNKVSMQLETSEGKISTVADTGGLQWFQLNPPLKERAPLIRDDWYHEEQKSP